MEVFNCNSVYMIKSKDINNTATYVGKTGNYERRIASHISNCNNPRSANHNYPVYTFIREFGGMDNFYFILVKTNLNDIDATLLEATLIRDLNPYLNKVVPLRSEKEYYSENKNSILQKRVVNGYLNRDKCRAKWTMANEKNRQYINAKMRVYRKENRLAIQKRDKIKYFCRCGKLINHRWVRAHLRSDAHTKGVEKFNMILQEQKNKICEVIL